MSLVERVLIIGGGFVGSMLARSMSRSVRVLQVSRFSSAESLQVDYRNLQLPGDVNGDFPLAILAIGSGDLDAVEQNHKIAADETKRDIEALIHTLFKRVGRLVFISSDNVFSGPFPPSPPKTCLPTDQPFPISAYGRIKLQAEELVAQSSLKHTILRVPLLVSRFQHKRNLLTMIGQSMSDQSNHVIEVNDEEVRYPTFIEDIADLLVQRHDLGDGIIHFSSPKPYTRYQLYEFFNLKHRYGKRLEKLDKHNGNFRAPRSQIYLGSSFEFKFRDILNSDLTQEQYQ